MIGFSLASALKLHHKAIANVPQNRDTAEQAIASR